jgi:hypothetical protein
MQHSLAAIRAGRSLTTFVAQPVAGRQRRLGLQRPVYTSARSRLAARRPVDALRAATRGHAIAPATTRRIQPAISGQLSWSRRFETGLRRARSRSAAPWRA